MSNETSKASDDKVSNDNSKSNVSVSNTWTVDNDNPQITAFSRIISNKNNEVARLPTRATKGSAGYDFFMPCDLKVEPYTWYTVGTKIRVQMPTDTCLLIIPKSGLGFKYGMRLANTVGLIDSDYFYSDNGGEIIIKFIAKKGFILKKGDKFIQGLFVKYGTVDNEEEITDIRNGGFGSTGE